MEGRPILAHGGENMGSIFDIIDPQPKAEFGIRKHLAERKAKKEREEQEALELYRRTTEWQRQPRARFSDPSTSHDAAASMTIGPLEQQIIDYLRSVGPQTQKEISLATGIPEISCSPILRPLERAGILHNPEQKRPNPGTGRKALAWDVVRS